MKNLCLSCTIVVMLVACSGNGARSVNSGASSGSISTDESAGQTNIAKTFILTEDGVGSLKMMQPFNDMFNSNEGLYNRVTKESYVDESSGMTVYYYTLYMDEEMVASFSLPGAKSPIVMLHVYSPRVSMENGVKTGTLFRDFLRKKGAKAKVEEDIIGDSELGYSAWISLGKIVLYGWWSSEDILTEQGRNKAASVEFNNPAELLPEDIKPEVEITDMCIYRKDE